MAGYTHYKWSQTNASNYVHDAGMRSFLLQLDFHEKMTLKDHNHLIYYQSDYGPTFGGGHDLHISNDCYNSNGSYCNFAYTYNHEETKKYAYQNQVTWTAFCGASGGYNFKVLEYEVYKVSWK